MPIEYLYPELERKYLDEVAALGLQNERTDVVFMGDPDPRLPVFRQIKEYLRAFSTCIRRDDNGYVFRCNIHDAETEDKFLKRAKHELYHLACGDADEPQSWLTWPWRELSAELYSRFNLDLREHKRRKHKRIS